MRGGIDCATGQLAVGGDQVDVITMIPKGANPENFAPDPKQMAALSEAQIYFAIGVPPK